MQALVVILQSIILLNSSCHGWLCQCWICILPHSNSKWCLRIRLYLHLYLHIWPWFPVWIMQYLCSKLLSMLADLSSVLLSPGSWVCILFSWLNYKHLCIPVLAYYIQTALHIIYPFTFSCLTYILQFNDNIIILVFEVWRNWKLVSWSKPKCVV